MASQSKPTGLHIAIVFFVLTTVIALAAAIFFRRDYVEASQRAESATREASENATAMRNLDEEIQALKKLLGHQFEQVGVGSPNDPNTVLGAMREDIANLGGALADETYSGTLTKLRQELDTMTADRDQLRANLDDEHQKLLALQDQYQGRVDEAQRVRTDAEGRLQTEITTKEEVLSQKDQQIAALRTDANQLQIDLQQARELLENTIRAKDEEINNLTIINNSLRDRVDEITRVSFETPDGLIRRVDNNTGLVWINLGEADKLPRRTSFSVYTKSNQGVGRGTEDIKGSIEVTRITGPHLAEARILNEDLYHPISPGDPIYTPLWSPGRTEKFAFIGEIDLDGDGRSDRDKLHQLLEVSGAEISTEVDDEGNLTGEPIDVTTKFLVLGPISEPTTTLNAEDKARFNRIADHLKELRKQARENGVRIISLNDFLAYMGYEPKRRLFLPGEDRPYNLKSGAKSTGVNEPLGDVRSSGQVSGAYGNRGRESGGGTKYFRNGITVE